MFTIKETLTTPAQNTIELWEHESSINAPIFLIIGTFHGDEIEGEYLLRRWLEECRHSPPKANYHYLVIPCFNPDGKVLKTRQNANGVDLNRNYPTHNFEKTSYNPHTGQASSGLPASEIETQWLIRILDKYPPARILSIHSDLQVVDYDGPAQEWATQVALKTGYPLVENVGYPCPGSFGTYAGVERQIPLITLEVKKARTNDELYALYEQLKPFFDTL